MKAYRSTKSPSWTCDAWSLTNIWIISSFRTINFRSCSSRTEFTSTALISTRRNRCRCCWPTSTYIPSSTFVCITFHLISRCCFQRTIKTSRTSRATGSGCQLDSVRKRSNRARYWIIGSSGTIVTLWAIILCFWSTSSYTIISLGTLIRIWKSCHSRCSTSVTRWALLALVLTFQPKSIIISSCKTIYRSRSCSLRAILSFRADSSLC